ncbi:hypothetical protein IR123_10015 [Streptococcus sp. 19428wC2_LYSM12]|uniref:hypothetical protein n=1 Tax=unclassified Streptococcus TaxID=2608887 RepID=UPI0010728FBC|nr:MULTISPECIES: hypothetical protein [unclassified Streptococcus]MBF0788210.1 hypothetical protein [Streptococcus sp. 19428wC2_LYSM12]TFV04722.1 hypothetical protein E4T79_10000 [Streptococcus sp. LYSM12]
MTQDELIEMMNSDVAIGVREWIQLRDHYLQCIMSFEMGYRLSYITEYVKFLEDYFMEGL